MKRKLYLVVLIFLIFFAISFLTNILGAIIPNVSDSFSLSGTMTGMLPFSFFIAYALMSVPSGMIVQKINEKKCIMIAWILAFAGAQLFAVFPVFPVFLVSLFLIGSGMAMLQVVLFPLLRVTGGEEHFAFNNIIVQLVFGAGSFVSPFVYSYLVTNISARSGNPVIQILEKIVPGSFRWVSIYWVFAVISFILLIIVLLIRFPVVERKEDEIVGAWDTHLDLLRRPVVILFFFGIFSYVGIEQGISNWISEFLRTYHGVNPETTGAATVGLFWGMMTAGCFLGLILLKLFDSRLVLRYFTISAIVVFIITLMSGKKIALAGFPALGFCLSVLYGIIFSLALNSIEKFHGSFSGILCTGIAGGAIFPLIIGRLKDIIGLRTGMLILLLPMIYVVSLSFRAKPLISNAIIKRKDKTINSI